MSTPTAYRPSSISSAARCMCFPRMTDLMLNRSQRPSSVLTSSYASAFRKPVTFWNVRTMFSRNASSIAAGVRPLFTMTVSMSSV